MTTGAVAAAAATARAIKASGAIVRIDPEGFKTLLHRSSTPLVVTAKGGFLGRHFAYLMGYKGLVFYTTSSEQLDLPSSTEIVQAQKIWIPG
jgi:hypothetical protein